MLDYIGETRQFWPVRSHTCTHGVSDSAPRTGVLEVCADVCACVRVCVRACARTNILVPRATTDAAMCSTSSEHPFSAPEQYMLNLLGETRQFWPVHNRPCAHGVADSAPRAGARVVRADMRGWCARTCARGARMRAHQHFGATDMLRCGPVHHQFWTPFFSP